MLSMKATGLTTDLDCPECNARLHIKVGRNGHFLACSAYPQCDFSSDYKRDEKGKIIIEPPVKKIIDKKCAECGKSMVMKRGKYGTFLACTGYPDCKYTESLSTEEGGVSTGAPCTEKGCNGTLVARRSKRGKIFYGCNNFPKCRFAIWDKPVNKPCPECGAGFLIEKSTKKDGDFLACLNRKCGHKEPVSDN